MKLSSWKGSVFSEIRVFLVAGGGDVAAVPDSPRVVRIRGVGLAVKLTPPGGTGGAPPPPPRAARWLK